MVWGGGECIYSQTIVALHLLHPTTVALGLPTENSQPRAKRHRAHSSAHGDASQPDADPTTLLPRPHVDASQHADSRPYTHAQHTSRTYTHQHVEHHDASHPETRPHAKARPPTAYTDTHRHAESCTRIDLEHSRLSVTIPPRVTHTTPPAHSTTARDPITTTYAGPGQRSAEALRRSSTEQTPTHHPRHT